MTPLMRIIEAALLSAGEPLTVDRLQSLFSEAEQPTRAELLAALQTLAESYQERGIELKELATGYVVQTKQELQPWLTRLWPERPIKYSRATLETLAVIAYRQPVTRAEIEAIRGVAVSTQIIKALQEREWIRIIGQREIPGRPALYGTTQQFLDHFNLRSLDALPPLSDITQFALAETDPATIPVTIIKSEDSTEQQLEQAVQ